MLALIRFARHHLSDGFPVQSAQEESVVVAVQVTRGQAYLGLARRFPGARLRRGVDGFARQFQFAGSEQKADELESIRGLTLNASAQLLASGVALFEQRLEIPVDHRVRSGRRFADARGKLISQRSQLGFAV